MENLPSAQPRLSMLVYDPSVGDVEKHIVTSPKQLAHIKKAWYNDIVTTYIPATKQAEDMKKNSGVKGMRRLLENMALSVGSPLSITTANRGKGEPRNDIEQPISEAMSDTLSLLPQSQK